MRKVLVAVLCLLIFSGGAYAIKGKSKSRSKKNIEILEKTGEITRCATPPRIDGELNDEAWKNAQVFKDFYQFEPYNGADPSFPSEVKLLYDDKAIYVGAMLYDNAPDSILKELSRRDELDRSNTDIFAISFNPFNDGVNMVEFKVSAAGVQQDVKYTGNHEDKNWNAVWHSDVSITEGGWIVEIKIPFSALRFPKNSSEAWGLHMFRQIRRYREWDSWNFVNSDIQGLVHQDGKVTGIKDIKPPLRLSFTPYVSGYIENDGEGSDWNQQINGGLDFKFGITESFTLDMTLIPDFGQVQSDDRRLNLSPFEIRYSEKRPFFTEGTELFNKGGIFYSRRVGTTPTGYDDVEKKINENEIIDENPLETSLINATKISGRTSGGLGIGFFNAMTGATYANVYEPIYDTAGNEVDRDYRKILTQGFTNYNMLVIDQSLPNNSFISLANTNVMHDLEDYTANVTATEFRIGNKNNSWEIKGKGAISQKYLDTTSIGHMYNLQFGKTSGRFQFDYRINVESDTYDPNDLGFLRNNNEFTNRVEFQYKRTEPFWKLVNLHSEISFDYSRLYKPGKYNNAGIGFNLRTTWAKNYLSTGLHGYLRPFERHDYFEPRVWGRVYKAAPAYFMSGFISTDYRKMFALDVSVNYTQGTEYGKRDFSFRIGPRIRFSDKFFVSINARFEKNYNQTGYVDTIMLSNNPTIYFGKRDRTKFIPTIDASYKFNNKSSLNLRIRHNWEFVEYDNYYELKEDGYLSNSLGYDLYGSEKDINYNAFTVDLKYEWNFAPGSILSVVWKNAIYTYDNDLFNNYFDNVDYMFGESKINSFSVKLLYYLDSQYLKRKRKS